MRPPLEKIGVAEVLLNDRVVASGSYNLVLPQSLGGERAGAGPKPVDQTTALGTIRLENGHLAAKAIGAPAIQVRLDHQEELLVDVYLYVPGAAFVAFTCSDMSALRKLLAREDRGEDGLASRSSARE
jgi:hypothetical protein